METTKTSLGARGLIALIELYRNTLGAIWLPACRFTPTCSEYARDALQRHGALRGSMIGVRRILKCRPFCEGGVDLLP